MAFEREVGGRIARQVRMTGEKIGATSMEDLRQELKDRAEAAREYAMAHPVAAGLIGLGIVAGIAGLFFVLNRD
jgi:hypothetical protein